jgi:hypothetical protein
VAPKTEAERLFGAACVRVTLERAGHDPSTLSLYTETLGDLEVTDEAVTRYLVQHRAEVESRLDAHRGDGHGRG